MSQQQARPKRDPKPEPEPEAQVKVDKEKLDADVDAILDEIDSVLDQNAEEFVKGFIQKGGQ